MNNKKSSISKPILSVTEMAQQLQLSRARFYQLLDSGFFPKPKYDKHSNRPYYDIELQQKCVECRETNIGINNTMMLFYTSRKKTSKSKKINDKRINPQTEELTEALQNMGLKVSQKDVQNALDKLYPGSNATPEMGILIRELFLYLKQ